jgi:hypothetical protein
MAKNKPHHKVTVKSFKKNVVKCSASLTQLAKLIGVDRYTLRTWMHKPGHEQYIEMFEKQKEFMIGESEDVIFESIVNGRDSKWAAWYLKTMTDKYTEKSKVEHSGDLSIDIKITDVKNNEK